MTPLDSAYREMVGGSARLLFAAGSNSTDAQLQASGLAYGLLQRQATMLAFVDDFWLMGVMFLILIPLMFMMKKARPQAGAVTAH